ncbi:isochorismatase family protein [Desulfobulbus rhabdoformis]|nr:isochorismatase family protein [Desulfobulbus rhabdoformis]
MMNNCLLLIDIQNDYFPHGSMELVGIETAASNAKLLLEKFRAMSAPIVHIQHVSTRPGSTFFLPESAGVEISPIVAPRAGETIIQKHFPNSFRETSSSRFIRKPSKCVGPR